MSLGITGAVMGIEGVLCISSTLETVTFDGEVDAAGVVVSGRGDTSESIVADAAMADAASIFFAFFRLEKT
jgi:hypothetical protein